MGGRVKVLIMGAGTVGNRVGDVLLSSGLDIDVTFCKYDAQMDRLIPGEFEIKTRELKELVDRYAERNIEVYAASGPDLDRRVRNLQRAGFICPGGIDDLDFKEISLVIDTSNGAEVENFKGIYKPNQIPFAIVGGLRKEIESLIYAGIPSTVVDLNSAPFRQQDVTVVSCNTHCITTAIGKLKEVMGSENFRKLIRHIDITFCRRHEDPHRGVPKPEFTSLRMRRYHIDEIETLIPETKGLITTTVSKWPTEYFHTLIIDFDFYSEIPDEVLTGYLEALRRYQRCIVTEGEVDHKKTIETAWEIGIRDGDIPFPVYLATRAGKYTIKVLALTPQRGIVAPSTADYVLLRTGFAETWREAFGLINSRAMYKGFAFSTIKAEMEKKLKA